MGKSGDDPTQRAVEELLMVAQEEQLLKIRLHHGRISSSSSSLDPDLARRFDALKSRPPVASSSEVNGDDLAARFAALGGGFVDQSRARSSSISDPDDSDDDGDGVSKKEVEKLMQWAVDAVRLDLISGRKSGEEGSARVDESEEEESDLDERIIEKMGKNKKNKKNNREKNGELDLITCRKSGEEGSAMVDESEEEESDLDERVMEKMRKNKKNNREKNGELDSKKRPTKRWFIF
ncbi:uncharacterized protein LOC144716507 [Wolffia australiana]